MQLHHTIPLLDLGILNPLISDYLKYPEKLSQVFKFTPNAKGMAKAILAKQDFANRKVLVESLKTQYASLSLSEKTKLNLNLLKESNTFTVCTAHQLCLFTGPSYFIYKILSAINLCKELKLQHPDKNFVPVYWMGSEDHDFEEINHAFIYGKKITWENHESGAIGRRSLEGISEVIIALQEIIGDSENAQALIANLKHHFTGIKTYGQAFQSWILDLFSSYGLIVLDQDDASLKQSFTAVMKEELLDGSAEKALMKNESFLTLHYHVQASSRPINLFYLHKGIRERIERVGDTYNVLNTAISFSEDAIIEQVENHPEQFSPNVILRPLYQETVLPNAAFIGGPGEVAYWLQLKDVFDYFKVNPPAITLRDMAVILPKNQLERLASWEIQVKDLFAHYDQIAKDIVESESVNELSLKLEKEAFEDLFARIKTKALVVDKNMGRSVEAEQQKVINSLENIEGKLLRAEKKNFELKLNQLENIQQKLLPNNTLQERYDNFIPHYLKNNEIYFDEVLSALNVFGHELKVFES
jgi:bacillithiol biosynthesis cysteine-adding enzyme BshC